jgi:hypothetical protein
MERVRYASKNMTQAGKFGSRRTPAMTEGEEGKLNKAERGDRALRSIALFVEGTRILSFPTTPSKH